MAAKTSDSDSNDYELLPHKEIIELKKEVDELKAGPSAKQLMETMNGLKKEISDLTELFKSATQEIRTEDKDERSLGKRLDKIANQNKVIAEAMVSLSDRFDQQQGQSAPKGPMQSPPPQQEEPKPRASPRPSGPPGGQRDFSSFSQYESSREPFSQEASDSQEPEPFTPKNAPGQSPQPFKPQQGPPQGPQPKPSPLGQAGQDDQQDSPGGYHSASSAGTAQSPFSSFDDQEQGASDQFNQPPGFEPPEFGTPQFPDRSRQAPQQGPPQGPPQGQQPGPQRGAQGAGGFDQQFPPPPGPQQGPPQGQPPQGRQPGTPPPADFSDLPDFGGEGEDEKPKRKGLFGAFKK